MVILPLVTKSLSRRKMKALVSMLGLTVSLFLLLALIHVKNNLSHRIHITLHQTDLIIGAPSQPAHLALFGLFRVGNPPPALRYDVYQHLKNHSEVASAIPLSVMESHRGFPVTGTTPELFETFYEDRFLSFAQGNGFIQPASVVLGANVAEQTRYQLGEMMTIAQGAEPSLLDEYSEPFTITGILAATGTALDNSILVSMDDLKKVRPEGADQEAINLIWVRLHNRQALLPMQQQIKEQMPYPVEVVIPNQALDFIQRIGSLLANMMIAIVLLTAGIALITVFFSVSGSLSERRYEIDTLRMLGARSHQIIIIGLLEPLLIMLAATVTGFILFKGVMASLIFFLPEHWLGWVSGYSTPTAEIGMLLLIMAIGSLLVIIPAWRTYGQCTLTK